MIQRRSIVAATQHSYLAHRSSEAVMLVLRVELAATTQALLRVLNASERSRQEQRVRLDSKSVPLAAWRVGDQQPARITRSSVALERSLEDWIEADPSLVFDGLVIVGRQVGVAGGRLDLLGLDPSGRWMVVEIKAGRLYRDVIAQALDYVASVRRLPTEHLRSVAEQYLAAHPNPDASERLGGALTGEDDTSPPEVAALVVGTARYPGLERVIDFLTTDHGIARLSRSS
jgi:hypothetical protein